MAKKNQAFFNRIQLQNEIFNVGKHEHKVFMPNEIFTELKGYENDEGVFVEGFYDKEGRKINEFKSSTHIAFAYAYVYLSHYMYRYCKYYTLWNNSLDGNKSIDESMIKRILGFPSKSNSYSYITKKGGILDRLGYIRKESDRPLECILHEHMITNGVWEINHFVMTSEYPENYGNSKNRKINFPVKAFYRGVWAEEDGYNNGTFWEIENTHMIDIDIFMYCMADKDLGVEAFYMYSFLLYQNDKFKKGFTCSIENLVSVTGLTVEIVKKQLRNLEKRNMITNNHMPFCKDKPEGKKTKANTYGVKNFGGFSKSFIEWNVIPKQRKLSAKQYEEEIGFIVDDIDEKNDETNLSRGRDLVLEESPFE
ncbi:hypothetical protein [Ureibacillus sinduriensis]|uniref:Uncharacterized protein n=1 Tax=Ureibacillus sinduriensis BLB-1 = JCM 15800 TaxID=1384057 RepID=A0A0A3HR23_9BACL|nr:hypothetical protein [Ureibacillus sinduriensis]KGR75056.1 hypothetical protein CD33_12305 [Ureibacillus sinduriensis BLB-1 = JCM 15800]